MPRVLCIGSYACNRTVVVLPAVAADVVVLIVDKEVDALENARTDAEELRKCCKCRGVHDDADDE